MDTKEIGAALALLKGKAIEQVPGAVEEILEEHPDWTTTVEDGAITKAKLTSTLKEEIEGNTEDVTALKNALNALDGYVYDGILPSNPSITIETGGISSSTGQNNQNSAEAYKRTADYIDVSKVNSISLIRPSSSYYNYYNLYNASKEFISQTNLNSGTVDLTGASFVRLNGYKSGGLTISEFQSCFTINWKEIYLEQKFDAVDEDIEEINEKQETVADVILDGKVLSESIPVGNSDWINGYVDQNGGSYSSSTLMHTSAFSVQPGDKVEIRSITGGVDAQRNIRFVAAYNNDAFVSLASTQNVNAPDKYTVPNGVNKLILTTAGQAADTNYTERRVIIYHADDRGWFIPESLGKWILSGDLSDGEALVIPENNVKNQKVMVFSAIIGEFDKIQIGRTLDGTFADWRYFEIDDTNVTLHDNVENPPVTASYPHGLTIGDTIQIKVTTTNTRSLASFEIVSNGIRVDMNDTHVFGWIGDKGNPFVRSDGSTLTGCTLSWTSRNIDKPVWVFGDSYISLYDVRWAYYMIEDGYDASCILNGYAGETSKGAIRSLKNLLKIARPQYIVWLMGMNDPDPSSDTKVNDDWKACYDILKEYCEGMGITLVLSTVPNVPSQINTWKNDIVRNSGYRYIDMAKAVGAEAKASTWYPGMLSNDNIHPTSAGAIAEYYQLLADFPEITSLK